MVSSVILESLMAGLSAQLGEQRPAALVRDMVSGRQAHFTCIHWDGDNLDDYF